MPSVETYVQRRKRLTALAKERGVLLDGKLASDALIKKVTEKNALLPRRASLAIISVGADPASKSYIAKKLESAKVCGIRAQHISLEEAAGQAVLMHTIQGVMEDNAIDGCIVQLPLPGGYNEKQAVEAIAQHKDADGFHEKNKEGLKDGSAETIPATPAGILELMNFYDISLEGKHVVVVGSNGRTIGAPLYSMLSHMQKSISFTLSGIDVHTENPECIIRTADIIIAATGVPSAIHPEDIQKGAYVLSAGLHRTDNGVMLSDVELSEKLIERVSGITPVFEGVGPMTVASLMQNTVSLSEKHQKH